MSVSTHSLLRILDLLHRKTDMNHPLSLSAIVRRLNSGDDKVSVRTVRRILDDIAKSRDELEFEERTRCLPDGSGGEGRLETIRTNYYLQHAFTDGELRFLMDQVCFSPQIPATQRRDLLEKIRALGSDYFEMRRLLVSLPVRQENRQLFLNVELVDEAIRRKRRISLSYLGYDIHKKLTVRCDRNGRPRLHILSPYALAVTDGKYYLICNNDRFHDLSHYRLDRMHNIRILETAVRPLSDLQTSYGRELDLEIYWQQHAYMMAGDHIRAVLRLDADRIGCLLDAFGDETELTEKNGEIQAVVRAGRRALLQFVRIHSPCVEVLAPITFRREAAGSLRAAWELYSEDESL